MKACRMKVWSHEHGCYKWQDVVWGRLWMFSWLWHGVVLNKFSRIEKINAWGSEWWTGQLAKNYVWWILVLRKEKADLLHWDSVILKLWLILFLSETGIEVRIRVLK